MKTAANCNLLQKGSVRWSQSVHVCGSEAAQFLIRTTATERFLFPERLTLNPHLRKHCCVGSER